MKIKIYEDELWPFYDVTDADYFGVEVDIDPALDEHIHDTFRQFWSVQRILRKLYKNEYDNPQAAEE